MVNRVGFGTCMPNELRRAMKNRAADAPKENPRSIDSYELKIREDASGLFALLNGDRIEDSRMGSEVRAGEVWNCGLMKSGYNKSEFIAMSKVSDAPEAAEKPAEAPVVKKPVQPKSKPKTAKADEALRKENAQLKKEVRVLRKRNEILTEQNKVKKASRTQLESRDRRIGELEGKLESEKKNVKALKSKNSQARIDSLNGTISSLEAQVSERDDALESKDIEITMLREKLKQLGVDDIKMVPRMPRKVMTCLTGPTGIKCSLLSKDRYSVYFSPRKRTMRFVPDEKGDIICNDGIVQIDGLSRYSSFQMVRSLAMEIDGECVVISL